MTTMSNVFQNLKPIESKTKNKVNFLVYGEPGSGKTCLIETCPLPIIIHNFDTGGLRSITNFINQHQHDVLVDDFSGEDPEKPEMFVKWERRLQELKAANIFANIGTFVLDSLTTFCDSIMNYILWKGGMTGKKPTLQQYQDLQILLKQAIQNIVALPCHTLVLAHTAFMRNELTGAVRTMVFITGQMEHRVPLMFDELYYLQTRETQKGIERRVLTQTNDEIRARTRIGRDIFQLREEPNISNLLAKSNYKKEE